MTSSQSTGTKTLRVLAEAYAKPGSGDALWVEIFKLVGPTRAEDGNISYEVLRNHEDSNHFIFFEEWTTRQALDEHLASQHIADYLAASKNLVSGDLRVVTAYAMTN